MASYAAPGGGVGPHFDSYDVFLLQTMGRRRWRIGRQSDLELVPDTPVKILARFAPDREFTVEPGDLLYLPPQYAHDGVAIDECITCSIGFRAPAADELAHAFLDFLHDGLDVEGRYGDPGRLPTSAPGRLPHDLVDYAVSVLDRVRWSRADVERFVGGYLTEPKPHVVFDRPRRPLAASAFAKAAQSRGLRLAPATRMLMSGGAAYMNGERAAAPRAVSKQLAALADSRELAPRFGGGAPLAAVLYAWYAAGYIELNRS
jgi:50S ribosomal protein L16 3-hydroxylase